MTRITRFALDRPSITVLAAVAVLAGGALSFTRLSRELAPPLTQAHQSRTDGGRGPVEASAPDLAWSASSDRLVLQASIRSAKLDRAALQKRLEMTVVPALEAIDGVERVTIDGAPDERLLVARGDANTSAKDVAADAMPGDGPNDGMPTAAQIDAIPTLGATDAVSSGETVIGVFADILPDANAPRRPVYPLPSKLQALNFKTTADLSPEVVRMLRATSPSVLDEVVGLMLDEMSPEALAAIDPDVVGELPDDLRHKVAARLASLAPAALTPAAQDQARAASAAETTAHDDSSAAASASHGASQPAVRSIVVAEGDTLHSVAERFGADPDAIRRQNGLSDAMAMDAGLPAGELLQVPLPAAGSRLPAPWQRLGATDAADISPAIMAAALAEHPQAVSDLTPDQILAMPRASLVLLPLPFIMRQPEAVREQIMARVTGTPAGASDDAPSGSAGARPRALPSAMSPAASPPRALPSAGVPPVQRASPPEAPKAVGGSGVPAAVSLGDVATTLAAAPATTASLAQGEGPLGISVVKEGTAASERVVSAVLARLGELENADGDWDHVVIFEQAALIENALAGSRRTGFLGALLAVLVLLVLRRSVRAALVTAMSIPVSIGAALVVMRWLGLSLSVFTLSGLIIAVGLVANDAIVVIENMYRNVQRGEDQRHAVLAGAGEVARAMTLSTLVACAAILPLAFVGGLTGQLLRPLALTLMGALLASLLVALTLVPVLARGSLAIDGRPGPGETALQRLYTPILRGALNHRVPTLAASALLFAASFAVLPRIPRTFLPGSEESRTEVELTQPAAADLATTHGQVSQVEPGTGTDLVTAEGVVSQVEPGTGTESSQPQAVGNLTGALPVSILVIYLILALGFGSLLQPVAILASLPLAFSGGFIALALTGRPLSIGSLVGLLLLMGIVLSNAIVLIDAVRQYRSHGVPAREALILGGRARLRPVLVTALVTLGALIPPVTGASGGALIAAELATVVIGGLVTSTAMTTVVVPVVYSLLQGATHPAPGA